MRTLFELSATSSSDVRGSNQLIDYTLQPVIWLKEIIDAAKQRHIYSQFAKQAIVPKGANSVVFQKRTAYIASSDYEASASENNEINWTTLNNLDGIEVTPVDKNAGVALSKKAIRTNAVDLVSAAKDELVYHAGDLVDIEVRDVLTNNSNQATSSARGAYTVYGGDARAESELSTGDTITPDMIIDAKTKLSSSIMRYWTPASPADEQINTSVIANPWKSDKQEPFVLIIGVEQEGALLKDSQFANASEFGSREPILNGEISRYDGVHIISTANAPAFTTSSSLDGGSNAGANGHRCVLFKASKAVGLGWGQQPALEVFDYKSNLQVRVALELAYKAATIHKDAICYIDVADK